MKPNYQEVISYNDDNPTVCFTCGNRTKIIMDMSHTKEMTQIHECLSLNCTNSFITQVDS